MSALLKPKRVHVSPGDEIESLRFDVASKDQKIRQLEEALTEMSLLESKIDTLRNDKKALELVNKESFVHDGRFVVPVPLSKLTNGLSNNMFSVQKRLMSLQKRATGYDAVLEFIKVSFNEMQENGYIEKVQAVVSDNAV